MVRMLDSLSDPAMLFDGSGQLLHANPALDRLVGSADAARLRSEAQCMAWTVGASARRRSQAKPASSRSTIEAAPDGRVERMVRIGATVYHLRGSAVGQELLGAEPARAHLGVVRVRRPPDRGGGRLELGVGGAPRHEGRDASRQ